ncbi:unnamed protein product [Caretta caretta]
MVEELGLRPWIFLSKTLELKAIFFTMLFEQSNSPSVGQSLQGTNIHTTCALPQTHGQSGVLNTILKGWGSNLSPEPWRAWDKRKLVSLTSSAIGNKEKSQHRDLSSPSSTLCQELIFEYIGSIQKNLLELMYKKEEGGNIQ